MLTAYFTLPPLSNSLASFVPLRANNFFHKKYSFGIVVYRGGGETLSTAENSNEVILTRS